MPKTRVVLALCAALVLAVACNGARRGESGEIIEGGELSVFSIRDGDCFDDPREPASGEHVEISDLSAVPCAEPHDNEAYAVFEHPADGDAPYPGDEAIDLVGAGACLGEFDRYVGIAYEDSRLDFDFISPTRDSWERTGDREVICFLYDLDFAKLTGSMKGSRE